jgi:hypothetical protein
LPWTSAAKVEMDFRDIKLESFMRKSANTVLEGDKNKCKNVLK